MVGLTCRVPLLLFDCSKVWFLGTWSRRKAEAKQKPWINEWQKIKSQNKKRTWIWKKNLLLSWNCGDFLEFSGVLRQYEKPNENVPTCSGLGRRNAGGRRLRRKQAKPTVPDRNNEAWQHELLLGEKSWNASLSTYIPSNWVVRCINYIMFHHIVPYHIRFISYHML